MCNYNEASFLKTTKKAEKTKTLVYELTIRISTLTLSKIISKKNIMVVTIMRFTGLSFLEPLVNLCIKEDKKKYLQAHLK